MWNNDLIKVIIFIGCIKFSMDNMKVSKLYWHNSHLLSWIAQMHNNPYLLLVANICFLLPPDVTNIIVGSNCQHEKDNKSIG